MPSTTSAPDLTELLVVPGIGHGRELLRVVPAEGGDGHRILSVPACARGLSRGTVVAAEREGDGMLHFRRVLVPSAGATVHCTVSPSTTPQRFDSTYVMAGGGPRLGLGPVSVVEPELVAVHVADRNLLARVTGYLDRLILLGVLAGWSYADPGAEHEGEMPMTPMATWELEHPPAVPMDLGEGAR